MLKGGEHKTRPGIEPGTSHTVSRYSTSVLLQIAIHVLPKQLYLRIMHTIVNNYGKSMNFCTVVPCSMYNKIIKRKLGVIMLI